MKLSSCVYEKLLKCCIKLMGNCFLVLLFFISTHHWLEASFLNPFAAGLLRWREVLKLTLQILKPVPFHPSLVCC